MHKRVLVAFMASMATLVLAAGCGGGDDEATARTLTKAEFIVAADRICDQDSREMPVQLLKYQNRADPNDTAAQAKLFEEFAAEVLLPILETRLEKFDELGVPKGDKGELEAFMKAMERGIEADKEKPATTLLEFEKPFEPAIELGSDYGFKRCAR